MVLLALVRSGHDAESEVDASTELGAESESLRDGRGLVVEKMVHRGLHCPSGGPGRAHRSRTLLRRHGRRACQKDYRGDGRQQPDRKEGFLKDELEYEQDSRRLHQRSGHYRQSPFRRTRSRPPSCRWRRQEKEKPMNHIFLLASWSIAVAFASTLLESWMLSKDILFAIAKESEYIVFHHSSFLVNILEVLT